MQFSIKYLHICKVHQYINVIKLNDKMIMLRLQERYPNQKRWLGNESAVNCLNYEKEGL